jgi:3-oxoacyl-[acyl-carrier-protein] synthase II
MGIVSPFGTGVPVNAEGFRVGRPTFRPVTLFDVSRQRVRVAAEVDLPATLPSTRLGRADERRMERSARMLLLAAHEAWGQSRWAEHGGKGIPLVLGTTSGGMTHGEDYFRAAHRSPPARHQQVTRMVHYQPQRQALDVMAALGLGGPVTIIANACASGANAIGHAFQLVRSGRAPRVMAGGYDALCQLVFAGFDSLHALSPTRCRPFDAARDGLALGEGAAVVCMESWEDAVARGVPILGEIAGYGVATDVHHLTQPEPHGTAALAAMRAACTEAGIVPSDVGYVNAHGTGTPANDVAEAHAITAWAGASGPSLAVSSTKGAIGHLLGAAGAVEVVACLMALQGQWLPPQPMDGTPDAACGFTLIASPQARRMEWALSNSFGFGGANASIVVRRAP